MSSIDYEVEEDEDDLFEDATEGDDAPETGTASEQPADDAPEDDIQMADAASGDEDGEAATEENGTSHKADIDEEQQNGNGNGTAFVDSSLDAASFKAKYPQEPSQEAKEAATFDIVPFGALLHGGPVYCMDFSWGLKWLFTGGQDGYIRKYNFLDTINGKTLLTAAQRHPFVDSITKAGVIQSYWENEVPFREEDKPKTGADGMYEPKLSPVYSLAVQSEAVWLLAGLENGGITLQTVRHGEGQIQAYLDKHESAVSCIKLSTDERSAVSGSWDKTIVEWDLDTGRAARSYVGSRGQISSLDWQPVGGALIPESMNKQAAGSGDDDDEEMGSLFGSDDEDGEGIKPKKEPGQEANGDASSPSHPAEPAGRIETSTTTFLSSGFDGTILVWDRRQRESAGRLSVPSGTPPWCTSACWSTDGNMIYAGRRNASVDEYDIRAALHKPSRTLKFPAVSGAVSCVAALPTGRHLMCGSHDNVRMYNLQSKSKVPFTIIPGHHGGVISSMYVDPSCHFFLTASGNRGWQGNSTDVALVYEMYPQKK